MNQKENRGITLVALVITIIVLIILAGVSINAVMNGGLITNAKDARDEYDKAKQEEEATLSQLEMEEIELEFLRKGIPYKYKKGYITGINFETKVQDFLANFPKDEEYAVFGQDGTTPKGAEENVGTGMVLKRKIAEEEYETIGTIVIYGDVNRTTEEGDGVITINDSFLILIIEPSTISFAKDVNHDNIVDWKDEEIIQKIVGSASDITNLINQNVYVSDVKVESKEETSGKYIASIQNEELKQKFQWNEEDECWYFEGVSSGTTVGELLDAYTWPENTVILRGSSIRDENIEIGSSNFHVGVKTEWEGYTIVFQVAEISLSE